MPQKIDSGIERRGPAQYRARFRRFDDQGVKTLDLSKTFETRSEAQEWISIHKGKVDGDEFVDRKLMRETTVGQACLWYLDQIAPVDGSTGKRVGKTQWNKNQISKLKFWIDHEEVSGWAMVSLKPRDLREIVAECQIDGDSNQTIIHRLNALSKTYSEWSIVNAIDLSNPVIPGVRPPKGSGRNRRLEEGEEERLLKATSKSSRPWLRNAIILAIETGMRQRELSDLTWNRVRLDDQHPSVYLNVTKNKTPRTVPLSERAVEALRSLKPEIQTVGAVKVFPIQTPRAVAHAFHDIVEGVFDDLRWHDLRHEAISRFFEFTDLRDVEIQAIVGHLGAEMLLRYTHLRSAKLGAKLPKLRSVRN
ncbi:site-specific integrase [Elstera cyanobacteriorum]|uniref:site-specific integrase n=1 Tax=Elstera cyanobacteriorum TaxID=2022747 RepID=UPI002356F783|nr:site-specific integrase [Elstera cyanobacteriorum]MCK6442549.1 site-specific integrase [Elstera cyanobacteriorum]